jgi:hypothetical protein
MKAKLFLFILLFSFTLGFIDSAEQNNNASIQAKTCLNESGIIMNSMALNNFSILRVNETLYQAELLYNSQVIAGRKVNQDFSKVIAYCDEIKKINADALIARDDLVALLKFYDLIVVPGMNTSKIDSLIDEIKIEIKNERYENVPKLYDQASKEMIDTKASFTALRLFVDSTSAGVKKFFIKNWKWLSILVIILALGYYIFGSRIAKFLLNLKIERLKIRKKTIKELIMKTQKDYFEYGKIAEGEYTIKTKKFADLILDIDRQIPLLQEQLIKIERAE